MYISKPWARLRLALWVKSSADDILKYFFLFFSRKHDLTFHVKLETICMKCQILFSGKNSINLSSAENAHRVVKVNNQTKMRKTMTSTWQFDDVSKRSSN